VSPDKFEQKWWFRGGVGLLTLASGIALFTFADLRIHSLTSVLIAFLSLAGLERLYSGLLAILVVLVRSRRG
jgi:hypothetical protein